MQNCASKRAGVHVLYMQIAHWRCKPRHFSCTDGKSPLHGAPRARDMRKIKENGLFAQNRVRTGGRQKETCDATRNGQIVL